MFFLVFLNSQSVQRVSSNGIVDVFAFDKQIKIEGSNPFPY